MTDTSEGGIIGRGRRWLAIASVVLGAAAVVCGLALALLVAHGAHLQPPDRRTLWNAMWAWRLLPPTVVLATLALVAARLAGRGARLAGGTARLLAVAGLVLALWPVWPRSKPYRSRCLTHVKDLAIAVSMYVTDYNAFPPSEHWADATLEYTRDRDLYRCPDRPDIYGYAYNAALGGLAPDVLANPARVPAIFESDRGWNAHGGKELLPDFPRHLGGDNLGFVDGHSEWYARQKPAGGVRWDSLWPREYEGVRDYLRWEPRRKERAR